MWNVKWNNNEMKGNIPIEFENLKNLTNFILTGNQFSGFQVFKMRIRMKYNVWKEGVCII